MNFSNFYFDTQAQPLLKEEVVVVHIDESEYDRLTESLNKDYRFVIESDSYKDDYGYGYRYLLRDGQSLTCLNRYKDEVDNTESMFFSTEDVCNMIRQKYTIKEGD